MKDVTVAVPWCLRLRDEVEGGAGDGLDSRDSGPGDRFFFFFFFF